MGTREKSFYTSGLYTVENLPFHYVSYSVMHMHVQRHLKGFFSNPTFQGTQPLHSETAELLASCVYIGIIFVTINMQTGDD